MNHKSLREQYLKVVSSVGPYSNQQKLQFKTERVFRGIDLKGKTVLDIGGGDGMFSFYAACSGAAEAVCLEPIAEGSAADMDTNFGRIKQQLQVSNVSLVPLPLQDYASNGRQFDIVLSHDSINHLDEPACIDLQTSEKSKAIYAELFGRIYDLVAPGGLLIICDCSRRYFFNDFNMLNPFVPAIEWHKHQAPGTWAKMLQNVGFTNPKVDWSSPNVLGSRGQFLANKPAAYFLASHFRLIMTKA